MQQHVIEQFLASAELKKKSAPLLAPVIIQAADAILKALNNGKHLFACGNGGSACDAQHLASELVNRFETERRALPAMALTTDTAVLTSIANDASYAQVFSRQLQAWGNQGDILCAISTSGSSKNIVQAVKMAQQKNMLCIFLSGRDGGEVAGLLRPDDFEIRVPARQTARIQEVHLVIIHCLCELIDKHFAK
jgi:D-sedoheptulose 7-phosphate isomerase